MAGSHLTDQNDTKLVGQVFVQSSRKRLGLAALAELDLLRMATQESSRWEYGHSSSRGYPFWACCKEKTTDTPGVLGVVFFTGKPRGTPRGLGDLTHTRLGSVWGVCELRVPFSPWLKGKPAGKPHFGEGGEGKTAILIQCHTIILTFWWVHFRGIVLINQYASPDESKANMTTGAMQVI